MSESTQDNYLEQHQLIVLVTKLNLAVPLYRAQGGSLPSQMQSLSSSLMQKSAEGRDFGGEHKSGRDHVEMTADGREFKSATCEASCDQTTIFRFGNKI